MISKANADNALATRKRNETNAPCNATQQRTEANRLKCMCPQINAALRTHNTEPSARQRKAIFKRRAKVHCVCDAQHSEAQLRNEK